MAQEYPDSQVYDYGEVYDEKPKREADLRHAARLARYDDPQAGRYRVQVVGWMVAGVVGFFMTIACFVVAVSGDPAVMILPMIYMLGAMGILKDWT